MAGPGDVRRVSIYACSILPRLIDLVMRNRSAEAERARLVPLAFGVDPSVRRWQDHLNPLWARVGGGRQLNRPIDALLEAEGFRPTTLDPGYSDGPRPMRYLYRGIAARG